MRRHTVATQHMQSRRDFLKAVGSLAAATWLPSGWLNERAETLIRVPPTFMLHSRDRDKLIDILPWLKRNDYVGVTYRQFYESLSGKFVMPAKPVIIVIDDINTEYINLYFPQMADMLEKAGFVGTFGVVTRQTPAQNPGNWRSLRELAARGWQLETHTTNHWVLPQCLPAQLQAEIVDSAKMIEDGTGYKPIALVLPFGAITDLSVNRLDGRIFDYAKKADLKFVSGIVMGRYIHRSSTEPYYVGRVGAGYNSGEAIYRIQQFYEIEPFVDERFSLNRTSPEK